MPLAGPNSTDKHESTFIFPTAVAALQQIVAQESAPGARNPIDPVSRDV
jgi:hypothetical protein